VSTLWGREPVAVATAVQLVLAALVALNVVDLTEAQLGAVMAAVAAVLGLLVRSTVWAPAHVEVVTADADEAA